MTDETQYADVLGQFPILKTYHAVIALFPLKEKTLRDSVVQALEDGIDRLVTQIPWLADQVINEGKTTGSSGVFKLAPWPSSEPPNKILRVKDCSDLVPIYEEIIKAKGPISLLDGNILCPVPGFPLSYNESDIGPAPVVIVQANFIEGGLLLNFSFQHNIMDMTGLFTFMSHLATTTQRMEISAQVIKNANLERRKVVPLFGPSDEPIRNHDHLLIRKSTDTLPLYSKEPIATQITPPAPPVRPATWVYFRISMSFVAEIRAKASAGDPDCQPWPPTTTPVSFVSTNDALSAFYWKRLSTVRLGNGYEPSAVSKFSRAIDARKAVGVPREYMGQLVYFAATFLSLKEITESSLSAITHRLRADLNDVNNAYSVRSYATFLAGVQDKSTLAYGGPFNRDLDIASSSGTLAPMALNFGPVIGSPDMLRRPNLAPLPGCLYFFPLEDKCLPILVCLKPEEVEGLVADPEWSRVAELIG